MTPLFVSLGLIPFLAAAWLLRSYRRMLRKSANSLDALAALLANCRRGRTKDRGWRMSGTFRGRKFDILQLDKSAIASFGSCCAIKLENTGSEDVSLRIGRRRPFDIVRQILGHGTIQLRNGVLSKHISLHCSDSQFARELLNFNEYDAAILGLWDSGKRRGTMQLRKNRITYKTRWRLGGDFIGEMRLALGLMCDLHDFVRSRSWQLEQ